MLRVSWLIAACDVGQGRGCRTRVVFMVMLDDEADTEKNQTHTHRGRLPAKDLA